MTIVLSTPPYQQFFDDNGNPLSGGLVYTYSAGTLTPRATYTDQGGLTPSANPIVLDSAGRAQFWLDNSASYKFITKTSLGTTIQTVDNVAPFTSAGGLSVLGTIAANTIIGNNTGATAAPTALTSAQAGNLLGITNGANDFRLTLTTGTPVTTSDVTAATTIYCTPYKGNRIALYDGSTGWNTLVSSQFSLALGTLTSGKAYDVFCYNNSGTPTLEFLVWTSDTVRATALTYQDGILVKTGATTRRYLGSFYTTATTTTEDSAANRYLYNYYWRQRRFMKRVEATTNWTYTTATFRQANGAAANQLNFIQGVAEDAVQVDILGVFDNSASAFATVAIGLDSTSARGGVNGYQVSPGGSGYAQAKAEYREIPSAGRHFIAWLEWSTASGTTTWYGTNTNFVTGMYGEVWG